MALWLVRAGRDGEDESTALSQGVAIIRWLAMPDLSAVQTPEDLKRKLTEVYPEESPKTITNYAAQLGAFLFRIQKGDMVVLPTKTRPTVAVGRVTGDYEYRAERHVRPVEWLQESIPRDRFGRDLLDSFGAFMTVCQIRRNDAEMRVKAVLASGRDPHLGVVPPRAGKSKRTVTPSDDAEPPLDLATLAMDQMRARIQAKFKDHDLTRLVEAILNAQGYYTRRSPAGSDGGVDIVAGRGSMGMEQPRLCVQVKSGGVQTDATIRELEGVMSRVGAQQGLFVSWDGFTRVADQKVNDLFFKVRLWDSTRLMETLLANYERLPKEIQAELPLKSIWVLVPEEQE